MFEPARQERLQAAPLHRLLATGISRFLAARSMIDQRIEQLIARPGLKAHHRRRLRGRWKKQQGRHRAEMNQKSSLAGRSEKQAIGGGGDGMSRPPRSAIAMAKAVDDRQTGLFGDPVGCLGPQQATF